MRVLITGAAGRLGAEVSRGLSAAGHHVVALSRTRLDICNPAAVEDMVREVQPDVIANCSSYNAVDAEETDAASAFAANADGPAILA